MRTDIHRPSAINPEEYSFVAFDYVPMDDIGASWYLAEQREIKAAHFKRTGGRWSGHDHGGSCGICGNVNAIYTACFYHEPSNTYIHVGDTCAQKLDFGGDFDTFKTHMKDARDLQAGKRKAQATLGDEGYSRAWEIYTLPYPDGGFKYEENTVRDIVGKLVKYGKVSDKQMSYIGVLLKKIDNRAEIEAQRAADKSSAKDAPKGRAKITGTVLKVKLEDTFYGETLKVSVKAEDGFIVYGTLPGAYNNAERGDVITFTATFTPKEDDSKFAFFNRPTVTAAERTAWDALQQTKADVKQSAAIVEEATHLLLQAQTLEATKINAPWALAGSTVTELTVDYRYKSLLDWVRLPNVDVEFRDMVA